MKGLDWIAWCWVAIIAFMLVGFVVPLAIGLWVNVLGSVTP